MVPHPISFFRALSEAVNLAHSTIRAAMDEEVAARRPFWIGGVPTEMDLRAARKAVARRLKITPEIVAAMLATPSPTPEE